MRMSSEALLKLTNNFDPSEAERFKDVTISGPHDTILIRLRQEEQRPDKDMSRVTPELCEVPVEMFPIAVSFLQKKGLIEGAMIERDDKEFPIRVDLAAVRLTETGISYERRLG